MPILGRNISPRRGYTQLPTNNPIGLFANSAIGNWFSASGNGEDLSEVRDYQFSGLRSAGSFVAYKAVFDVAPDAGLPSPASTDPIVLANLANYKFFVKFYESGTIDSPLPITAPLAIPTDYDFSYQLPTTMPSGTHATDFDTILNDFTYVMDVNTSKQSVANMIGRCYIGFQQYPNTSAYGDTTFYPNDYSRIYIYRESILLRDMEGNNGFKDTPSNFNWQAEKFIEPHRLAPNPPSLLPYIPRQSGHYYPDAVLGTRSSFIVDIFGIDAAAIARGRTPRADEWLFGRAFCGSMQCLTNAVAPAEYATQSPTKIPTCYYFNIDRNVNQALNSNDITEVSSELRLVSNNALLSSFTPLEKMRFKGVYRVNGLNTVFYPNGPVEGNLTGLPLFSYMYAYIVREKPLTNTTIPNNRNIEAFGNYDTAIADAFIFKDLLSGTYFPNSVLPTSAFPDFFLDNIAVNRSPVLYGPLTLSTVSSNTFSVEFDIDLTASLYPSNLNGSFQLGENYRIILVFEKIDFEDFTGTNVSIPGPLNYSLDALAGASYSWLSNSYKLEVTNIPDPDPDPDPEPDPPRPRPTVRTCTPTTCSYIEDYIKAYPDYLEATPLDRLRSVCTFYSRNFDLCRIYPQRPQDNNHFESGVTRVSFRLYKETVDGNNNRFRHNLDLRVKTPNSGGPTLPYVGDPGLDVTVQPYNPNTGEYGYITLSADYRIRDEKDVPSLETFLVDPNSRNEILQGSAQSNQDWTNQTIYAEFKIDVSFTVLDRILTDTFIKRQVIEVIDFDSNKPEVDRILKLEIVDANDGSESVVNDFTSGDGIRYVRTSQVINDDDTNINPEDPLDEDYHISLLRVNPFGQATTSEFETIPANTLPQLQQPLLISSSDFFTNSTTPVAYGGFDIDTFNTDREYEYAVIKKKHTVDLDDCTTSFSNTGFSGVYYYPFNLGSIADNKYLVCTYQMFGLVDGLRFSHNNQAIFWTKSNTPYETRLVARADFDLSDLDPNGTAVSLTSLEDSSVCFYVVPFEYTFNPADPIIPQIQDWVASINSSPGYDLGYYEAFYTAPYTLSIVWYDVLDTCCGGTVDYKVATLSNPSGITYQSIVQCCGPNQPLNPRDTLVVPDLVADGGAFVYELPKTLGAKCFNLGELLVVAPECVNGDLQVGTQWKVSIHCPMTLVQRNTLGITQLDPRFDGTTNGMYGFVVYAPPSDNIIPSLKMVISGGNGTVSVFVQDNGYTTFGDALAILPLTGVPTLHSVSRPNYSNYQMPHWIVKVELDNPLDPFTIDVL